MILPPKRFRQLNTIYSHTGCTLVPIIPEISFLKENAFLQGMKNTTGIDFIKIINKTGG